MGLDTTHGCWRGSYIAFMHWREKIALLAGLPPLGLMAGFWLGVSRESSRLGLTLLVASDALDRLSGSSSVSAGLRLAFDRPAISWDALAPRPLLWLLRHSDCDGEIPADQCAAIADDLETLLPKLDQLEPAGGHIGIWGEKTRAFIAGLRLAASRGEPVEFQ